MDMAKVKHAVDPMLWSVSKKGMTGSAWLFGTVHVADPRITNLHPAAASAFKSADRVYTEVDMSMEAQLATAQIMMRKDGKTMTESLGPELVKKVNAEIALVSPMLTMEPFNPMKTWLLVVILPQLKEQMEGKQPLDLQLWNKAKEAGKKTLPLETAEEQMGGMNALTEKEQVTLVQLSVDRLIEDRAKGADSLKELLDLYLQGDVKQLGDYFEKEFNDEKIPKELVEKLASALFYDRNQRIANNIDKELTQNPDQSHFFAVGTGHYLNDKNIRQFLEKKGYTVRRVTQ